MDELRLDLSGKQGSLEQFKKQRDSINDNKSQEYISLESQVKTAQIEVNKINDKIKSLKYYLDNLCVYAKTSGVIVEVGYEVGVQGTVAKSVVVIGDEKKAYLDILVPQTDIVDIKEDQEVNVTLEAYPDTEIKGKVIEKSYVNSADGMDVDYKVKALLEINDLEVYQGMTGEIVFIIKGKEDVLKIPNKFIYMKDNKQMVKVMVNNELQDREIKTGFSDGKFTEIVEGLKSGEIVIEER
ncbi:MAG: efflux RND transporter periplasmic adaptor subunit [Clostridium sp.]